MPTVTTNKLSFSLEAFLYINFFRLFIFASFTPYLLTWTRSAKSVFKNAFGPINQLGVNLVIGELKYVPSATFTNYNLSKTE